MHRGCFNSWVERGASDSGQCATCRRDLRPSLPDWLAERVEEANARKRDEAIEEEMERLRVQAEADADVVAGAGDPSRGFTMWGVVWRTSTASPLQVEPADAEGLGPDAEGLGPDAEGLGPDAEGRGPDAEGEVSDDDSLPPLEVWSDASGRWHAVPVWEGTGVPTWEIHTGGQPVVVELPDWNVEEESALEYESSGEESLG